MKGFTEQVKQHTRGLGARLVGVTDVERLVGTPRGHRAEVFFSGVHSVVVIGLPVLPAHTRYPQFLAHSEKVPKTVNRRGSSVFTEECFNPQLAIANHI